MATLTARATLLSAMRAVPVVLSLLLAVVPAVQAYGETMADAHCRAQGHISAMAVDAAHDPLHAQHHADGADASAHEHAAADSQTESGQCECGCLCDVACAGGVAAFAVSDASSEAPPHERWASLTDPRHPVSIHESLLRPPRFS